jgi:thiol-disulfide isomerase/thioredoxin
VEITIMDVDRPEGEASVSRLSEENRAVRPKPSRKQFWIGAASGFVAGILFIIGGAYILGRASENARTARMARELEPPVIPLQMADMNWTVRSLDGREFHLADARGKVVFVNFWATWCLPCRAEMASIQSLYEKLKDDGVVFVCVSKEDSSTVREYLKGKGYSFPIYTLSGERPASFAGKAIPATFIVGPDGRIALRHVGTAKWDGEESVQFIRSLRPRT